MPLSIGTFNVKDLLAARDSDAARARLEEKLDWIARLVARLDVDVLGLQEVGSSELVRALVRRLGPTAGYGEPVMGTVDSRGIGCALVARVPVVEARVHTADALAFPVFVEGDAAPFGSRVPLRRGVVHARVDGGAIGAVDVFVAHFKSRRPVPLRTAAGAVVTPVTCRDFAEGEMRALVWRASEALHVRGLVDAAVEARADARIAVVGDMNDAIGSAPLDTLLGARVAGKSGATRGAALHPCAERVPRARRFSVLHEDEPTQIDHVLVTGNLYARLAEVRFFNEELRQHPPVEPPSDLPTIDSDHAPLVARFG
jgi:endonuclease/exonuclease/phosphatase family metal-dependent hydrolase